MALEKDYQFCYWEYESGSCINFWKGEQLTQESITSSTSSSFKLNTWLEESADIIMP